jgi:hypothetical protein
MRKMKVENTVRYLVPLYFYCCLFSCNAIEVLLKGTVSRKSWRDEGRG